jgi:IS6 family transposase
VRKLKADGSLPTETGLRSSKCINSRFEQDHRGIRQRIVVMLGFKQVRSGVVTIAGIEPMHRFVRESTARGVSWFRVQLRPDSGTR